MAWHGGIDYIRGMRVPVTVLGAIGVLWSLTQQAQAVEVVRVDGQNAELKRFYPLERTRQGIAINRIMNTTPLRSDNHAMQNGFMRLDRARTTATLTSTQPLIIPVSPVSANAGGLPRVIRGDAVSRTQDLPAVAGGGVGSADDSLLSLYSGAPSPLGFRETLRRGGVGGSLPRSSVAHQWPLPLVAKQSVSSGFGMRADPFDGGREFHGGIDISAAKGTPVLASADGVVSRVDQDPLYGKSIGIRHADNTESLYGHLSEQTVRVGQSVHGGDRIGAVGATGRVTGAHLDYRLKIAGENVDPLQYLPRPGTVSAPTAVAHAPRGHGVRTARSAHSERILVVKDGRLVSYD